MAGRPPLRIGQHGNVRRIQVDTGIWIARCRYRDTDGVTRIVERRSPTSKDQWGKQAEDALIASFRDRRAPSDAGDISPDTKVTALVTAHIDRLEEDGKAGKTIDTYRYTSDSQLTKLISGLRVQDATPPRIDAALRDMNRAHGATAARHAKTIMRGGLQLAVMAGVLSTNPVRDVSTPMAKARPKGAPALDAAELRDLVGKLRSSEFCQKYDLVDPVLMLMATGIRRSELLGLWWPDYDTKTGVVAVTGKLVRLKGKGLQRFDVTKSAAGERTLPLPPFARDMLDARRKTPYYGEQKMIFPSTAGTWRDPDNFNARWREARTALGVPDVTSHSFRKAMGTLIDDAGLSARVAADQLGHAKVSMTQDVYMARGRTHTAVADMVERAINSDE